MIDTKKGRKLLFSITKKDLQITYFNSRGPGGQNKNKNQNCVRILHPDSGAMSVGQANRSLRQNMSDALQNLVKNGKFKIWHAKRVREVLDGITTEERVEVMMDPKNLKFEIHDDEGRWVEANIN